jgi:hypothetical protein
LIVLVVKILMGPGIYAGENSGKEDLETFNSAQVLLLEILRDDSEMGPQFPNVPKFLTQNLYKTTRILNGIKFTVEQLEES